MTTPTYIQPDRFSTVEWQLRIQLAAMYRIFAYLKWEESIYNHISLRIPGDSGHFLINPFGLHYTEVTASNLVKIDGDAKIIGDSDWPINPAGATFHTAIHRLVGSAHCIMHVHTTATQAVCCLEQGLSFSNFYAAMLHGKVAYHDFEGITVFPEEGERIVANSKGRPVVLLRNHGPVVMGLTIAQAFALMMVVQRACEVQLASQSMGQVIPIPDSVMQKCVDNSLNFDPKYGAGEDALAAYTRIIDKIDPSYKY